MDSEPEFRIGVDECGWGSIAGPLIVCAALIPSDWLYRSLFRDSKRLTAKRRQKLCGILDTDLSCKVVIGEASAADVDTQGPAQALLSGYRMALEPLIKAHPAAPISLDGDPPGVRRWLGSLPTARYVRWQDGADALWPEVSVASVVGKEFHDDQMRKLACEFPGYLWEKNKGYGSKEHFIALQQRGVTPHHRRSYRPVQKIARELGFSVTDAWVNRAP